MKKKILILSFSICIVIGFAFYSNAQVVSRGQSAVTLNGGYSVPVGELSKRFEGTYNLDIGYIYGFSNFSAVEFRVVTGKYDKLSDNPRKITYVINTIPTTYTLPPDLKHYYRYTGLSISMIPNIISSGSIQLYGLLGLGYYRFDYYRSAFRSYIRFYQPGDPKFQDYHYETDAKGNLVKPYPYKHITEWSWGVNGGLGFGIKLSSNAVIDLKARWEVILGDLWPTIFLGLEQVRPIQNVQLTGGIKFIF